MIILPGAARHWTLGRHRGNISSVVILVSRPFVVPSQVCMFSFYCFVSGIAVGLDHWTFNSSWVHSFIFIVVTVCLALCECG